MRAMTYRGPYRIRVERAAICGSDLHLYHGMMPDTRVGHTFGHEFIGVVEQIGSSVETLSVGDRVMVPFHISCGTCWFCARGLFTNCHNVNPNATAVGGIFGYSHATGGYDGGQAERVRVPFADVGPQGSATGAHWVRPETQPGAEGRERSIEHAHVTPVFGTAQPLSGLAGVVKRYAYRRFSEGRLAHWMLLVVGDRLDVATHRVTDALRGRPDRIVAETGIAAERADSPVGARVGSSRRDWRHGVLEPVVTMWPYLLIGGVAVWVVRRARR